MDNKDKAMWENVFKKNPDIVFRKIADEAILVPVGKSDTSLGFIYSLNEVAARVWELIDNRLTLAQIREMITGEFEVDSKILKKDMSLLIADLKDLKLIE